MMTAAHLNVNHSLREGRSSELAAPHHERVLQQSTLRTPVLPELRPETISSFARKVHIKLHLRAAIGDERICMDHVDTIADRGEKVRCVIWVTIIVSQIIGGVLALFAFPGSPAR